MKTEEVLFYKLVHTALHSSTSSEFTIKEKDFITSHIDLLLSFAKAQNTILPLYDSLFQLKIPLTPQVDLYFQKTVASYCIGSYNMLYFSKKIISLFEQNSLSFFVLKGITLLPCYPKFEFRRYGDLDIFIPDYKQFQIAKKILLSKGFTQKKDFSDHHIEFLFQINNRSYLLELHNKIIASQNDKNLNKQVNIIYHNLSPYKSYFKEGNFSFPMLPITENAVYLLLHMLQHFLGSGFGIKFLCDWVLYLEYYKDQIDTTHMKKMLSDLKLSSFCNAVTQLCMKYLGLSQKDYEAFITKQLHDSLLDDFMHDIMHGGEYGKNSPNRMLIVSNHHIFVGYVQEVHRQMKKRFPKLHKLIIIWPLLWFISICCFIRNNYYLRKIKTKDILFSSRKRQQLLNKLKILRKE